VIVPEPVLAVFTCERSDCMNVPTPLMSPIPDICVHAGSCCGEPFFIGRDERPSGWNVRYALAKADLLRAACKFKTE
jgi:hypothetical protein